MSFQGFAKEGVAWFQALAVAQNREWFQKNRDAYESLWLEPTKALVEDLKAPLAKIYKRPVGAPKLFRLNRDVRFSKDKSPYKTQMAAIVPFDGFATMESPAAFYFHLGLEEVVAFGFYALETPEVKRLRTGLLDEKAGAELQKRVDAAKKVGLAPMAIETLKRVPPGVDPEHARAELLKLKGLALSTSKIPKGVRFKADFKDWVLELAKASAPVVEWGFKHKLA